MGICLSSTPLQGADTEPLSDPEASTSWGSWEWLKGQRDQVSRNVTEMGTYLDEWLAGEGLGDQVNETYLRIRLNQQVGSYDGYNSKLKIGGRLDLPNVSERWKLIFDSDVEELNSLEENLIDKSASSVSIGGIRYQQETESGWDLSHDIGLRARLPADPFYRFKAVYGLQFNNNWSMGFSQKLWHYDSRGWGYDTEVAIIKELGPDRFIRVASEINFQDDSNELQLGQSIALHRTLGAMETISYELGVLGSNRPNERVNDYYVQALYRKSIVEDWLVLETAPQILVSRDENWRPQPRLIFNLEVLFFDF
jgi:hypothetical protein